LKSQFRPYTCLYKYLPLRLKLYLILLIICILFSSILDVYIITQIPSFLKAAQPTANTISNSILAVRAAHLLAITIISVIFRLFVNFGILSISSLFVHFVSLTIFSSIIINPFKGHSVLLSISEAVDIVSRRIRSYHLGLRSLLSLAYNSFSIFIILIAVLFAAPVFGFILIPLCSLILYLISSATSNVLATLSAKNLLLSKSISSQTEQAVRHSTEFFVFNLLPTLLRDYEINDKQLRRTSSMSEFVVSLPKYFFDLILTSAVFLPALILYFFKINLIIPALGSVVYALLRIFPLLANQLAFWNKAVVYLEDSNDVLSLFLDSHNITTKASLLSPKQQATPTKLLSYGVSHLTYEIDRAKLISNLSFSLKPSERLLIQSASGTGKTTLFNILLGFQKPLAGKIEINTLSYDVLTVNVQNYMPSHAYVGQQPALFNGNLNYNISLAESDIDDDYLHYLITFFEISHLKKYHNLFYYSSVLSGGEKQRIALARAFYSKPDLLFLDEPTSALDKGLTDKLMSILVSPKYFAYPPTVLMISHDKSVRNYFHHILSLSDFTTLN